MQYPVSWGEGNHNQDPCCGSGSIEAMFENECESTSDSKTQIRAFERFGEAYGLVLVKGRYRWLRQQ